MLSSDAFVQVISFILSSNYAAAVPTMRLVSRQWDTRIKRIMTTSATEREFRNYLYHTLRGTHPGSHKQCHADSEKSDIGFLRTPLLRRNPISDFYAPHLYGGTMF